ncbi:MAG: MFS transporter, partial [Woeseiaceae bacterium]
STLISRWFRKRRGLMLGISVTGSSIGGAIGPPLLTWLFIAYGWRTAFLMTGIFVLCLAPVFFRVLVNHPQDKGLQQEEDAGGDRLSLTEVDSYDWSIREMLATRAFWLQTLITGSMLGVTLGLLANLSLHAKDLGFVGQSAALLYSVIAFCSFFGKIAFGAMIDRIGVRYAGMISVLAMVLGLALLALVQSYAFILGACFVIGLATGGVSPVWTNLISRAFGARSFGRAMGVMNPLHIPITAPSAPLAGYISDTTGSYMLVFVIYIGLLCVAGLALAFVRQPRPREKSAG